MLKYIAQRQLKQFENHYGYDVSYMQHMLDVSPAAFFKFAKIMKAASHCEAAPVEALFAGKIVGALAEDCGPCVQLVVNMAREASMSDDQVEAVLQSNFSAMSEITALGFRFAQAIINRDDGADDLRDKVRSLWGEAGVIDLTLGVQIGRIFPMVKAGLGHGKTCQRIEVGTSTVDVKKEAA